MKLYLDSTDNKRIILRLDGEEFVNEYTSPREQDILLSLNNLLEMKKVSFDDLLEIEVNSGPGSFTGTRVGVAVANALAFALNIKVNGRTPPVLPTYSSPPNITSSKKGD